jgi:serine/threonine protein kinase/tetratricopeptide (TPR) repeat protein
MNPNDLRPPRAASSCPKCGSGSNNAFGFEGLCLRCAGVRVLELESGTPWDMDEGAKPLERIGTYEIIEELGHGGMGRVYAARQPGLGRIVAVKAIREGLNADLDLRFLREIETVARLRHPNIVAVHDSGRSGGQLYFSMDYIEGGDLAARLRAQALAPREAVYLMQKVAEALAYAHAQGVLHRDLKPSNILLDGREPRLADFGLAAQIEAGGDLTAATHILGTPHYLAPEAIVGGSAALSVSSDIYSAGVILFEMLTGRTPFAGASAAELPALVRESDPPSLRLLAPVVPRDLETVCLKCLDREPSRRYASAGELAADLARFLAGEPVLARPASASYRLRKLVRRHRLAVASSGLVALSLVGATVFSLWFAARARRAEHRADADSAVSQAVVSFLEHDLLEQAAPNEQPDRDIKLRTVVERAADKVSERFKGRPEAELGIRETLAQTYESLGDYPSEQVELDRAIELSKAVHGLDDERTLADLGQKAQLLARVGRLEDGRRLLTDVIREESRIFGPDALQTLHSSVDLIYITHLLGRVQDAEALARDLAARCTRIEGPLSDDALSSESDLSSMYFWEGKYALAETTNLAVVDAYRRKYGVENPLTLTAMANLAAVYANEDKMGEAQSMDEELYATRRRILGPDHPETLRTMNNLGAAYRQNGRLREADDMNTRCYEGRLKLLGPDHPDTIMAQSNLALDLIDLGRLTEAEALSRSGMERAVKSVGPDHFATLAIESTLAEASRRLGRLDETERLRSEIYASRLRHGGPGSFNTLAAGNSLALAKVQNGRYAEAEELLRGTVSLWKRNQPDHWRALIAENLLGAALAGQRRFTEALPLLEVSAGELERRRTGLPAADRSEVRDACLRTAEAYRAWGHEAEALDWARRSGAEVSGNPLPASATAGS